MIITYDGVNNSYSHKNYFGHTREKRIHDLLVANGKKKSASKKYLFMNNTSTLIKKIKKNLNPKIINRKQYFSDFELNQSAIELLESWLLIKKLADRKKAKFYCILQPNAYVGNPNLSNFKGDFEHLLKQTDYMKMSYKYYNYVRTYINKEKYQELKTNFIDMTDAFDSIPNLYIDFCHVTPKGNKIIVDKLVTHIE